MLYFFSRSRRNEFDKNANSILWTPIAFLRYVYIGIGLATVGVCVFCAIASAVALFVFVGK